MASAKETRIRKQLKDFVAASNEESREEAKILLEYFWKKFEIEMKLFMLYPLLKLLARAGKTRHEVMKVPRRDIEVDYEDFDGPISPLDLTHGCDSAEVYERVRKNGYRPIIIRIHKCDDEEGRYPEDYWAIVIDWS